MVTVYYKCGNVIPTRLFFVTSNNCEGFHQNYKRLNWRQFCNFCNQTGCWIVGIACCIPVISNIGHTTRESCFPSHTGYLFLLQA